MIKCNFKFKLYGEENQHNDKPLMCCLKTMPSKQSNQPVWFFQECDGEEKCVIYQTYMKVNKNDKNDP